jgi:hypothetical protein
MSGLCKVEMSAHLRAGEAMQERIELRQGGRDRLNVLKEVGEVHLAQRRPWRFARSTHYQVNLKANCTLRVIPAALANPKAGLETVRQLLPWAVRNGTLKMLYISARN